MSFKFYGNIEGYEEKIGFIELWKKDLVKKLKRNKSIDKVTRAYNLYTNGNATMSGKNRINYYYTIDGYPSTISIDFKKEIRSLAKSGVRVSFVSSFEPNNINWNDPALKSKIRTWKGLEEDREEVNEYNYYEKSSSDSNLDRRKASLVYLADASLNRKRSMFRYRTIIIVSGNRSVEFDKSIALIEEYCKSRDISITRVEDDMSGFLRVFSPFSMQLNGDYLRKVGSNTMPDELIARFSSYSQGKIGYPGIMFGTDIFSGYNVFKEVKKRDTDAENILITSETGGGKSFFLKCLLLQLIALPDVNGTINDIEGFEYIPFANYCANNSDVVILNMAEGQGCYYDPFEITLTGDIKLDTDIFKFSKNFTNSYFVTLVGRKLLQDNIWCQKVINNAISKAYTDLGVIDNKPETWVKTQGYDLFYVYSKFIDLYKESIKLSKLDKDTLALHERYKVNPEYIDCIDKVVAKLSEYFEPFDRGGIRADVFQRRVSLKDIADAKLVINSFGMDGKSADTVDEIQMTLMQLSAANISYLRSYFSKAKGMFNFKVWEEFQRWGSFPNSVNTIKTAITGGRKLGDINFIITNDVKELLDQDRFSIFNNITSFAVGAIASSTTRQKLCKELSVPSLQGELDSLVTKRGSTESFEKDVDTTSIYDKAFLVQLDKSVTTITKMFLPKHIQNSDIFKTGINLEGSVKEK